MATSRNATPANPTLVATTEDNSRGGLFTRSNIANPVEGVDVSGISINDSTITIELTFADGSDPQTQTFTTNQSAPDTLTFNIPAGTSGPSSGGDGNNFYVSDGSNFNTTTNILTLTREGLADLTFNLSSLIVSDSYIDGRAQTVVDNDATIVRTVNNIMPVSGNVTIDPGTVSLSNFESSNTVTFRPGTADSADISADAVMRLGNGTAATDVSLSAASLVVNPATGYQIVQVGSTNTYVLQDIPTVPQASAPMEIVPPARTALMAPPLADRTVEYNPAADNEVTMVGTPTVTRVEPDGTRTSITTATTDVSNGRGTVTIPEMDAAPPGTYEVMAPVTTRNTISMETTTTTERADIVRFVPFFQRRDDIENDITPTTDLSGMGIDSSDAAWSGSMTTTSRAGNTVWFAVEATSLASNIIYATIGLFSPRVVHLRTIQVTLADNVARTFNVFRTQAAPGNVLTNFRTSRFG